MVEVDLDSFEWSGQTPPREHGIDFTVNVKPDQHQNLLLWFYSGILKLQLSQSWQYIDSSGKKFFGHSFGEERQFNLSFQFNEKTLEYIEDKRKGQEKLDFKIEVELIGCVAGRLAGLDIDTVNDLDILDNFNETVYDEFYRTQWLELLE